MDEDNKLIEISELDKFLTNYKAVYQAMTAKHDCKSKIFPRRVKVQKEDIVDLNNRITDKLINYINVGFSTYITASFVGKQVLEFSSWAEFENHRWNESYAINSLTIIWEFNLLLPQYKVPQKHVLVVKVADNLRPEEMLNIVFAGKLENIQDIEKQMYPVVARVDFINYVLGDELLHIVEEWDKGLRASEYFDSKWLDFLKKHKRVFAYLLNYFTDIVLVVCGIKGIIFLLNNFGIERVSELTIDNASMLLWTVTFIGIVFVFVDKLSEWFANIFYQTLDKDLNDHVFELNKGDFNLQQKLKKERVQNKILTWSSVLMTFVINLLCSLACAQIVK